MCLCLTSSLSLPQTHPGSVAGIFIETCMPALAGPELLACSAGLSPWRDEDIWDLRRSLRNPVSRQTECASAVTDAPPTTSSYGVVGCAKHNGSTATLAYGLRDDALGLFCPGRTQRNFACTTNMTEESTEEPRTFHYPCLHQRIEGLPYVECLRRSCVVWKMEPWGVRRSVAGMR